MSHQHKEEQQLEQLKKRIEDGKMKKIQAETRVTSLKDQYKQTASELKRLGIDPKQAKETIQQMEQDIQKELEEIQNLLPQN